MSKPLKLKREEALERWHLWIGKLKAGTSHKMKLDEGSLAAYLTYAKGQVEILKRKLGMSL